MDDKTKLYRELNDSTATERWLEGFEYGTTRVLIGPNERSDNWSMAVSFFHGAESLREGLLKQSGYDLFRREYPMMFLYRHSVELFLKHALLHAPRSHNLNSLLKALVDQIKDEHSIDISNGWFTNEIRELANIDSTSQGFRYSHDAQGKPALAASFFVDIEDLGARMMSLYSVFLQMSVARGDFVKKGDST